MGKDKKPPFSIESEELVLGSILSRSAYNDIADIINLDCFYKNSHREIFCAILKIIENGDNPDYVIVSNNLSDERKHEVFYLSTISTFDVRQHAEILLEYSKIRKGIEIANKMLSMAYAEDLIEEIITYVNDEFAKLYQNNTTKIVTIYDAIEKMRDNISKNSFENKTTTGLTTGFKEIDKKGGLQKSDLVVIAGESSQGKTSLALSFVNQMSKSDHKIAFYSLEMEAVKLASRLVSIESGISSSAIMYKKLDNEQINKIEKSISVFKNNIYIDEKSTLSIETILTSIRSMKAKYDIECAVIDYLQIIPAHEKGKTEEQVLGQNARRLKNIAKELDICVIALSQLSRDTQNPEPNLARLRGSGQINEASDMTILIYRPSYYGKLYKDEFSHIDTNGTALINIAKGRNVGTFKFISGFNEPTTRFYELENAPLNQISEINPF